MYEKRCYQKLDERLTLWGGLELYEILFSVVAGFFVAIASGIFLGLGYFGLLGGVLAGFGSGSLIRMLHAREPGYVFSRLYGSGVLEFLPSSLRPRHLLPLPGIGREALLRLSPVKGEGQRYGGRDARIYFGK